MRYTIRLFCVLVLVAAAFGQDVAITVYNQNRALVREIRALKLASGRSTVSFTDVAALIDPTSVHFKSLTAPEKVQLLEQNYEYDLVSAQKVLEKYVDETVRLVMEGGEVFDGVLLNGSQSNIVLKAQDGSIKVIRGEGVRHFEFPELPEGLITRPTLVWDLENGGPSSQQIEVSYLTGGMNWHAEYVAVSDADDAHLDLGGWVSVENRSGTAFKDAKLKLVAGDVNLVQPERVLRRSIQKQDVLLAAEPEPRFEEKAFFEYHLYTLGRKTTLKNNQTKQIALFPPTRTKTEKIFMFDGASDKKVRVHLEFQNKKKDGLGLPLPKGKIRVYKTDDDGAQEFIGEDEIDHTPMDETVRIFLGNAFDLTGERVQQSTRRISDRAREESYAITLRNHKDDNVDIVVVEHFWGDWTVSGNSHAFTKKDVRTLEFRVPVTAKGEAILTFKVTLKW